MIGLGSNRLSVCRRGGMSVTQAGRGGMEWLAGGRRPRWSGPYSAQATVALKAQFPTQWPTIRDYGFAHPEIVGYMNAYAPEDAKIAYSLVEGIGNRFLQIRNNGTYGYNNGMVFNTLLKDIGKIKTSVQKVDTSGNWIFFAKFSGSDATNPCFGKDYNDIGATYVANPTPWAANSLTELEITINRSDNAKTWLGSFVNNSWSRTFNTKFIELISKSSEQLLYLVPFIRDNKPCMLDMDNNEIYVNFRSNQSFQIIDPS